MDELNGQDGAGARVGTWATRAALLSLASFGALILLSLVADVDDSQNRDTFLRDLAHVVRFALGIAFAVGGVGALALSLRGIFGGQRGGRIYFALAIGLVATGFFVAEFTVLE